MKWQREATVIKANVNNWNREKLQTEDAPITIVESFVDEQHPYAVRTNMTADSALIELSSLTLADATLEQLTNSPTIIKVAWLTREMFDADNRWKLFDRTQPEFIGNETAKTAMVRF